MLHLDYADLRRLLDEAKDDVLSLYLPIDPADPVNQKDKPVWRIALANALDVLERQHGDKLKPIRQRVERYLAHFRPQGKTLVLFVGPSSLRATTLPIKMPERHEYGAPVVEPLLWALDEFEHYLIVLIDSDHVRTVSAFLGHGETGELELQPSGHWGAKYYSRTGHTSRWESHVDDWQQRWIRGVADQLLEQTSQSPTLDRIVIGGNEKEAHALRAALHPKLRPQVVGVVPMEMYLEDHQVLEKVWPLAEAFERANELDIVRSVIDRAESGDRGALGDQAVGEALASRQVRRLILAWPVEDQALATTMIRRAFDSAAAVEFVHGEAAELLRKEGKAGGVAADLYWS